MPTASRTSARSAAPTTSRDALLVENLSLVHFVAKQVSRGLSRDTDPSELVNIGTLGLMSAVESFDPKRGFAFSTYAVPRIRGAILDELRKQDRVPRSVRRKTRDLAHAREALMRTLGRAPNDAEVAARLGIPVETLWRWQSDAERTVHVSLTAKDGTADDDSRAPIDFLRATGESADERLQREDQVSELRDAILELNEQQRVVVSLYYFEEMNARQIASTLGLSESRVSQIRSKALAELRQIMSPMQASA